MARLSAVERPEHCGYRTNRPDPVPLALPPEHPRTRNRSSSQFSAKGHLCDDRPVPCGPSIWSRCKTCRIGNSLRMPVIRRLRGLKLAIW